MTDRAFANRSRPAAFGDVARLSLALTLAFVASNAWAQRDRVYDRQGKDYSGKITSVSSGGIVIETSGTTEEIAAGDILKIMHEGDPRPLTRGREFALERNYEEGLKQLKTLKLSDLERKIIEADAAFYRVYCEAQLALAGKGDRNAAANNVLAFARRYRDSWHLDQSARLLGDLALALGKPDDALKYYQRLDKASSPDARIEGAYLIGRAQLSKGDASAALNTFQKVIDIRTQTQLAAHIQDLARAGKAIALAMTGQPKEGLTLCDSLIGELTPEDLELAARVYNAQGACYEALGDTEGAILSYLHTHLMFSVEADAHVAALQRLVQLWPEVGKSDRAVAAKRELNERYPGF